MDNENVVSNLEISALDDTPRASDINQSNLRNGTPSTLIGKDIEREKDTSIGGSTGGNSMSTASKSIDDTSKPKRSIRAKAASLSHPDRDGKSSDHRNDNNARSLLNHLFSLRTCVQKVVETGVILIALLATRNPKICVISIILLSISLMALGIVSDISVNMDSNVIFTPVNSRALLHQEWLQQKGMSDGNGIISIIVHADGSNVLHLEGMRHLFEVIDAVRNLPEYDEICETGDYVYGNHNTCEISSATRFWGYDISQFERQVITEHDLRNFVSNKAYPDSMPVAHDMVILQNEKSMFDETLIISAKAYYALIYLPVDKIPSGQYRLFEREITNVLLQKRNEWISSDYNNNGDSINSLKLEFFSKTSYEDEFTRAILNDLPLIPAAFVVMIVFTCLVFYKRDTIQSKCMLGLGAVFTVLLSIISGYGLLFFLNVPFTPMTNVLPFIVFGIGLDDAFIIAGEYSRHENLTDPEQRIYTTIKNCGLSITTTTATTCLAFMLGLVSTVPAIHWLCLYAFPMIIFVFLYQISFFVALIVLDERRIEAKKRDCFCCYTVSDENNNDNRNNGIENNNKNDVVYDESKNLEMNSNFADRVMSDYTNFLLLPWVKLLVIVTFVLYFFACIYSATLMEQQFEVNDLVPRDSYIQNFTKSGRRYTDSLIGSYVYFRDVDQSDPIVQNQMINYIEDLVGVDEFGVEPTFCWVRDMREQLLLSDENNGTASFNKEMDSLLKNPVINEVYGKDILRDDEGNIIASRCYLTLSKVDIDVVEDQIKALNGQWRVSAAQPINQGKQDWPFFTHHAIYFVWEFYASAISELISTTIASMVAIIVVGIFLVPNLRATLYIFPMICVIYIDLIGTIRFMGIKINIVSYIALVISIGLMVDFITHIVLRYYESPMKSREEKVRDTLQTMGASILLGGLSTCLSSVPLLFSTSNLLGIICTTFFAMATISLAHGLIFIPVVFSLIGDTDTTYREEDTKYHNKLNLPSTSSCSTCHGDHQEQELERGNIKQPKIEDCLTTEEIAVNLAIEF